MFKLTTCFEISLFLYVALFLLQVILLEDDTASIGAKSSLPLKATTNGNDSNVGHGSNHNNTLMVFPTKSLSILMTQVQKTSRPVRDETIDQSIEEERCKKFNIFTYEGRKKRRRIFAGGLIADDSWHVLGTNALESYGVFHSIALIESNRTQNFQPRKLRFTPGSDDLKLLQSGIFGPNTLVHVENFVHELQELPMVREHMMRDSILKAWKKLGMTRDDIGLIIDMDEVPSRDFLRAAQMCNPLGAWKSGPDERCEEPLVRLSHVMCEGSPQCIHKGDGGTASHGEFATFSRSAMVIGACIEGIGDSTKHLPVPRVNKDKNGNPQGGRQKGYGGKHDFSKIPKGANVYRPLYNTADFRQLYSPNKIFGGVGFHLHNFFDSADAVRFKYAYFGHVHKHAYTAPLGAMNADMNLFVKCAHNISDEGNRKQRLVDGLEIIARSYPLLEAFRLEGYVDARHEEMVALVEKDEEEYGRADKFDGHHLFYDHMLTHKGRRHQQDTKV